MVLVSTGITDEERKSYKKVVEKLDEYFHVRHNVIFERARFNRRDQLEGESGDQYITELYYLAERCSYGQLTSEMIRDHLVVGIRDLALSERLQLNPDLTLEKAKTMIRQREAVHTQQQVLKEAESGSSFKGENTSLGAKAPRQNQQVFLLQNQNKHLSSVSNAGKASILGILALPRSLCVINASGEDTMAHSAYQRQWRSYNRMRVTLTVHS